MCKDIITKKINYIFQFFIEYGASRSVSGGERLEHGCERSEQKLLRLTSTEFPRKTSAIASVFLQNEFTQTQQYSFFESSSSYS